MKRDGGPGGSPCGNGVEQESCLQLTSASLVLPQPYAGLMEDSGLPLGPQSDAPGLKPSLASVGNHVLGAWQAMSGESAVPVIMRYWVLILPCRV